MLTRTIARLSPALLLAAAGLAQGQCYPTQMVAGDLQNGAGGGASVAMDGTYILAGSPAKNTGWGASAGEVYCYAPISGSWSQVGHIIPSTLGQADAGFGDAVALGGNAGFAVVGAPYWGGWSGLAYIFRRDTQTNLWSQVRSIDPGYGGSARFGSKVAMNTQGTVAVVSAPFADVTDLFGTSSAAGRAEVYGRNPDGTWTFQMDLHQYDASIRHDSDFYGHGLGADGTTVVVGCRNGSSPTHFACGYLHIWERNAANQWLGNGEYFAPDQANNAYFGEAVAIHGNTIVVGAAGATHLGLVNAGAAYIYRKVNGAWVFDSILHATDPAASDEFGATVAVHGDEVVIGNVMQKVYLFRRTASGQWVQDARYKNPGQIGDAFGNEVAVGPGHMVTGAWGFDTPNFTDMGCTYIYDLPVGQSDSCAGAWPVGQGTTTGCTNNCTVDGSSSCGTGAVAGPDAWLAYTAPASGTVTIDTQGSSFDTILSVHTGCPGNAASALVCNDDNSYPSQLWSRVQVQVAQGATYLVRIAGYNGLAGSFNLNIGAVTGCYANCDGSTTAPVLNVLDFSCFLNKFAAGDAYANCDSSTTFPVLNVLDFSCFLNKFAAGCS